DLAGGKHFLHGRHSSYFEFAEPSPGPVNAGTRPESNSAQPCITSGSVRLRIRSRGPPALRSAPVVRTRAGNHFRCRCPGAGGGRVTVPAGGGCSAACYSALARIIHRTPESPR